MTSISGLVERSNADVSTPTFSQPCQLSSIPGDDSQATYIYVSSVT